MTLEFRNVQLPLGGGVVFSRLSFVAAGGEVTCLQGRGGISVLRAAMGLLFAAEGYVSMDGELVTPRSASALRRLVAYVPRRLDVVGQFPAYEPPTPADVMTLKANRGRMGDGTLLGVAEALDRPLLLVDNDAATPEWLRRMASQGRTVVVASNDERVAAAADHVVRLD